MIIEGVELHISDRGLGYAPRIVTGSSEEVNVYTSSAVDPCIWVKVVAEEGTKEGYAHLSLEQAKQLLANLKAVIAYRESWDD